MMGEIPEPDRGLLFPVITGAHWRRVLEQYRSEVADREHYAAYLRGEVRTACRPGIEIAEETTGQLGLEFAQ